MIESGLSVRTSYTIGGVLFGLLFPVFSWFVDAVFHDMPFGIETIRALHRQNFVHYVVDTAPLVLGFAGTLLGGSVQKKLDANKRLLGINKSLDTFTHKITHDLRGPAIRIKGFADILQSRFSGNGHDSSELLHHIKTSTDQWLATFEEFVELLKKEKEGIKIKQQCDLETVLQKVLNDMQSEIKESKARIKHEFTDCRSVYASEYDLYSIFSNLISNSIKYSHPDREPEIYIQSIKSQGMGLIMVQDNGVGINLEKYGDKLFALFERIDNKPGTRGTGVGLYLVRDQVEKNGGIIDVESTEGEGSSFTLTLPTSAGSI